jgi:hypothetical protein
MPNAERKKMIATRDRIAERDDAPIWDQEDDIWELLLRPDSAPEYLAEHLKSLETVRPELRHDGLRRAGLLEPVSDADMAKFIRRMVKTKPRSTTELERAAAKKWAEFNYRHDVFRALIFQHSDGKPINGISMRVPKKAPSEMTLKELLGEIFTPKMEAANEAK